MSQAAERSGERVVERNAARRQVLVPGMDTVARTFAAAAHPVRLQLLTYLVDAEHCVTQCMEHTGAPQSLVSKHLGTLIDAGLVERRRSGRRNYHRVVDPHGVKALLDTASRLRSR